MSTIHDVAKRAGVSSATVSRVINGGSVRSATKEKVQRVIEKLGYVPDIRATSLKQVSTKKIGLVISDIDNPVYPKIVKTVHNILKAKNYPLILGSTYNDFEAEKEILEMMQRERVAGLIISTQEGENDRELSPFFERILKNGIMMVFIGKPNFGLPIDTISIDSFKATAKITSYLIKTGRKRIAFLSGQTSSAPQQARLEGYKKALLETGVIPDENLIICKGDNSMETGETWGAKLLEKNTDAIVCINDMVALGVLQSAKKMGIAVPEQVAVGGFDDTYLASIVSPRLTTIHQPLEEMAKNACELLFKRIEGTDDSEPYIRNILLEPDLIVREST